MLVLWQTLSWWQVHKHRLAAGSTEIQTPLATTGQQLTADLLLSMHFTLFGKMSSIRLTNEFVNWNHPCATYLQ